MEKTPSTTTTTTTTTTTSCSVLVLPFFVIFMQIVLVAIDYFGIIARFVPRFKSFSSHYDYCSTFLDDLKVRVQKRLSDSAESTPDETDPVVSDGGDGLTREDVEAVMWRLGLFCSAESEQLRESLGCDELSKLFDESEPSLEEIKEAFEVFDHNRDGFVDSEDLRRVLCLLGLKRHGSDIEQCKRMIKTADANGDGKIDFHEFVKFMETVFC